MIIHPPLLYSLDVAIILSIFYACFLLIFRRTSFFGLNRAYLLITLCGAFAIPLLELPGNQINPVLNSTTFILPGNFFEGTSIVATNAKHSSPSFSLLGVIVTVYGMGVVWRIAKILFETSFVIRLSRTAEPFIRDGEVLYYAPDSQPFCFINKIFVPSRNIESSVILHELGHVRQRHWIDLVVLEVVCTFFWFVPLVWLYRSAIREQHEFLADEFVLANSPSTEEYLSHILSYISTHKPMGPTHKLISTSLKTRIIMMTKTKTDCTYRLLYLLMLPVFAFLLFGFAKRIDSRVPYVKRDLVIAIDPAHGGSDAGSTTNKGLMEKELTLSIALLVKEIGTAKGMNIVLTRTDDKTVSLSERVSMSAGSNADLFVSLHCGYDDKPASSGINLFVSEQNPTYSESQKLGSLLLMQLQNISALPGNGVKNSPAYVLKHNAMPAVILELGFLSNDDDAEFIGNRDNHRLIAEMIIEALLKY